MQAGITQVRNDGRVDVTFRFQIAQCVCCRACVATTISASLVHSSTIFLDALAMFLNTNWSSGLDSETFIINSNKDGM